MAASVLNTPRAVEMSVFVVRAFVKLRQWLGLSQELAKRLKDLESRVGKHDEAIQLLLTALRELANPPAPEKPKRRIGFHVQPE